MRKFVICMFAVTAIFTQVYGQTSWTKDPNNPVLPRGTNGEWDDQFVSGPYVLYGGNIYHMWYSGYDGGNDGSKTGYAYSSDGISWTRHSDPILQPGSAGSWDGITVFQPCVLFNETSYHMWFSGHNGITTRQIGYATSADSINWTKHSGNPVVVPGTSGTWDDVWVDSPEVLFIDGVYHMWYGGNDGTYTQIGHATSSDGIKWEKDTLNPVLRIGISGSWDELTIGQPSVVFDGDTYHMWYSGGREFAWDSKIGYARSTDGRNWIKFSVNNPVLDLGDSGSWDDTFVGGCGVIFNAASSEFKMWYSGGVGPVIGDIGYATGMVTSIEDNNPGELPQDFSLLQNYPNPFNPSTTIEFKILKNSDVTLKIFNILGEEVATLVSSSLSAGSYTYHWDASNQASGLYLYQLESDDFVKTRKMILMK